MSRAKLFVFVEGYTERFVYSKITDEECKKDSISYFVVCSEELPHAAGGKQALLAFYNYLRRAGSLIDDFQGKKTASIFFFDKDVDDFLRRIRRSQQVVYTELYEIENYLFKYGALAEVVASAVRLDVNSVRTGLGEPSQWLTRAAEHWKDWAIICLYAHTRIRTGPALQYYGRPCSQIHNGAYGRIDRSEHHNCLRDLERHSGLSPPDFACSFNRLKRRVQCLYRHGEQDKIFKGKWYCRFLIEDIRRIAGRRRIAYRALEDRLLSALGQSLDYNASWATHFRQPIRNVLLCL